MPLFSPNFVSNAWDVLRLFLIPIGGGIPAGVVLAQRHGLSWLVMCVLYLISDIVLACVFEPLMLIFIYQSQRRPWLARFRQVLAQSTGKTVARYGLSPGRFALVMITFGTDPMTGRSVAKAVGHGFLVGWTLTIIGDMLYFLVIMASTVWLNDLLGDGTLAVVIIMVAMIAVPALIRKLKKIAPHYRGGPRRRGPPEPPPAPPPGPGLRGP